ncbi:glycoside hydrolase family 61 protein [Xylaria intraflava]|nr:glycoside hydrolase family 61 protein [Xylaria intraflava]
MKYLSAALGLLGVAQAHYTFPDLIYGGTTYSDWQYIRETANHDSHSPVEDVTSDAIRCYELAPGSNGAGTLSVQAGDTVGFSVDPNIQHPGPLQFYMAKVPDGETLDTFEGDGDVWFKIYEDAPEITASAITWATLDATTVDVTIPSCLAPGDYLLRVEHIGLHVAQSEGGAQFFLACAQINVSGSGSTTFTGGALPGMYSATDPGLLINIYYPVPTSYTNPGPAPVSC